jgi:hypothetical protein
VSTTTSVRAKLFARGVTGAATEIGDPPCGVGLGSSSDVPPGGVG